jgi:hypothetical protein
VTGKSDPISDPCGKVRCVLDTGNLPVRTGPKGFWTAKNLVNAEPDFRSCSCLASNLDLNYGSVLIGSGLNHGSEPDLSITTRETGLTCIAQG